MRILITSFDYRPQLGGVATCAFELSRSLVSFPGVEVRVLAPRIGGDAEFDRRSAFTTVRESLPATATRAVLPLSVGIGRQALSWRPDAVLNLLWHPCGTATMMNPPLRAMGIPYFIVAHGVEVLESRHRLKKRLRASLSFIKRSVFRQARAIFPVSRFTSDLIVRECGVPPERMRVINNGVHPGEFAPGPRSRDLVEKYALEGKKVFLTVARMEEYKGVDRALSAMRYVVARHPELIYLVCGNGPDRERVQRLSRRFGLEGHVIFAGAVPPDRLVEFYNLADAFVLLSREDWITPNFEGFGIVFLEAAACEKPSIAGRSGGIPDAVAHGQTGWLVDPESEYTISQAMLECLEKPGLVAARGKAARERVLGGFTWEHVAQRVLDGVRAHVRD